MGSDWVITEGGGPVIAVAVHNGHAMRPDVAARSALAPADRLREEDPHTGRLAELFPTSVVVETSRYEVDLNRPVERSIYASAEEAWGVEPWRSPPDPTHVSRSAGLHRQFYADLAGMIDRTIHRHGRFVVFDIHSYNHRRGGRDAQPDPPEANPVVNLGTDLLPARWRDLADAFLLTVSERQLVGEAIDIRENVRFRGGYLSRRVNASHGGRGCSLAIECKKVFMDEWSGEVAEEAIADLGSALVAAGASIVRLLFDG